MDGPPPPPPPGPPPPPAPIPVKVGGGDGGPPGNRGALLSSIESFKKGGLKKTVTVDKSAPVTSSKPSGGGGGGAPMGGGGGGGASMGRGAPIAGFNPFAQGMPQLKKTGRGGGIYVSPGSQAASAPPKPKPLAPQQPAQPQKTSPRPGQPAGSNQQKQEEENRKRQEEERKRREEDERRRREQEKADQERRIQEEERRRREVERKERERIEEERRKQDDERRRQEDERRYQEERRKERERAEQERIEQRKRADRDREEEERQRQQRIENEKRKREEKRKEEERKDAEYRKQLEEAKAQAELRRKQEAAQKEESWKMHQKEREEKKRLSGSLQLSGSGSIFTTLLQSSPQQSPQQPQHSQPTDRLISNFENIISYQPDQLNVKEIGEELVRLVNAAKEIASGTQNPEKVARVTHLLQGLVLETKDLLAKIKENSPALHSSKAQLVKTLRALSLALNESDQPLSPAPRAAGGSQISSGQSPVSSHFASVPEANRAARQLELFITSLDHPTPRHQIDPGQLGQGIKSANTHLSQAVQVFNTLNNHISVEERRRNFKYEDFASHIVKFGEELVHTSGWTGDSEIRNSLISATKTMANATHGVICTLDMNGDVAQSREVWTKVVAATVNVLKQVLTLAAQHKAY